MAAEATCVPYKRHTQSWNSVHSKRTQKRHKVKLIDIYPNAPHNFPFSGVVLAESNWKYGLIPCSCAAAAGKKEWWRHSSSSHLPHNICSLSTPGVIGQLQDKDYPDFFSSNWSSIFGRLIQLQKLLLTFRSSSRNEGWAAPITTISLLKCSALLQLHSQWSQWQVWLNAV